MEEEKEKPRPGKNKITLVFITILVLVLVFASVLIFRNRTIPVTVDKIMDTRTVSEVSPPIQKETPPAETNNESTVQVEKVIPKEIIPAAVEEPEKMPESSAFKKTMVELENSDQPVYPYAEIEEVIVSDRIYSDQYQRADVIINKPLIINFKINVEYLDTVETVKTEEIEATTPAKPVEIEPVEVDITEIEPVEVEITEIEPEEEEVTVVETSTIVIEDPEKSTIIEYRLKDGLVIEVESGPKNNVKSRSPVENDIKSASSYSEEDIVNSAGSPFIDIISPKNGTFYTRKVQIEGRVANSLEDPESVSEIGIATWEIEGQKEAEQLVFGSDGVFFLSFSAGDYSGTLNIFIKAEGSEKLIAKEKIVLFDGNIKPELTLISPEDESVYGAAFRISGHVIDPSASDLGLMGPASLEYSLFPIDNSSSAEQVSGIIPVNPDGSFSELIYSNDFSGEQLVTITVHGRNGKTVESSVSITEADSDIPGFRAVLDGETIILSWDRLQDIENYKLFYTDSGNDPADKDGNIIPVVESPVLIRNLREGFLHRFKLEAVLAEGKSENLAQNKPESYRSGITEIILLNTDTLKPLVTPGYQQIHLDWNNISGSEKFDILRKDSPSAPLVLLEQEVPESSFIDRDVEFGKKYSYKVRPSLAGSLLSAAVTAESLAFPEEKTEVLWEYGSADLMDIEVFGGYIFLARGTGGMRIIDNADPSNPVEVSRYPSDDTRDILIRGERAYLADGFRGIKILDINDPGNPILLGSRKTIDATKLALLEDTVFIADGKAGIKIIDISSERRPERAGSFKTVFAKDLRIHNSELLIADGSGGLKIVDISRSPELKLISTFDCDDAVAVAVNNNTAYVADSTFGVRLIDISDSTNPVEIGQISVSDISDILIDNNYIFVSNFSHGLLIYEVSDPSKPVLFDNVKIKGASALTFYEGIIYLTDNIGFKTVKSFTTGRSFVIAEYQTDGNAYDLTFLDHSLYLSDHRNGVKIVDVSNPTDSSSFKLTEELDTSYAESVVSYGSRLIIADGAGGIVLGSISNLEDGSQQIELEESIDLPGITKSLTIHGDTAYIAAREEGMHLLDLETREINSVFTGGSVQEITVTDEYIYIADGAGGLKIYNNKGVEKPDLLSTLPLSSVSTVAITDNYIVAGGRGGLFIVDVSNAEDPVVVSTYTAGWIEDIYLEPGYIYAAAGYEGLIVLDMKKPEDLVLVSSCEDVYAVGVEVDKDLAFIADVDGFKVVKILIPSWLQ
jgi:hypothetical protein